MESFISLTVVIITIIENTKVHIGSATFACGCKVHKTTQININRIDTKRYTHEKLDDYSRGEHTNALNKITYNMYHSCLNINTFCY